MSFIKIWLHVIWSTKNREKTITKELKPQLLKHITANAREKGIHIDTMNCTSDHIHILLQFSPKQSLSQMMQLLKGESSFWVNKNKLANNFEWQDDYFAVSVSESQVDKVREYINNQEEHHKKKTFMQEYENFMKKFG